MPNSSDATLLRDLKRRLYAMRNGVVADAIRKAGAPYRIIFGLNLPQITEIAADFRDGGPEFARTVWADNHTRECLLIAPMLMPADAMDEATARQWILQSPCSEVSDILCHRLLKHLPYARTLAQEFSASQEPLERYTALRLLFNLLPQGVNETQAIARAEADRHDPMTLHIARALIEETEFLLS